MFLVGCVSFALFLTWVVSGVVFTFGNGAYPGAIAYVPKWIFSFSPFVLLYNARAVRRRINRLLDIAFHI